MQLSNSSSILLLLNVSSSLRCFAIVCDGVDFKLSKEQTDAKIIEFQCKAAQVLENRVAQLQEEANAQQQVRNI